ncbi:hypothetical protein Tco_1499403 [Tanacetum coccineum]
MNRIFNKADRSIKKKITLEEAAWDLIYQHTPHSPHANGPKSRSGFRKRKGVCGQRAYHDRSDADEVAKKMEMIESRSWALARGELRSDASDSDIIFEGCYSSHDSLCMRVSHTQGRLEDKRAGLSMVLEVWVGDGGVDMSLSGMEDLCERADGSWVDVESVIDRWYDFKTTLKYWMCDADTERIGSILSAFGSYRWAVFHRSIKGFHNGGLGYHRLVVIPVNLGKNNLNNLRDQAVQCGLLKLSSGAHY